MLVTELKQSEWKDLEIGREPDAPVWLKIPNGDIVLAVWINNTTGVSYWRKCFIKNAKFALSINEGYLVKDAKYQSALPEE